VRDEWINGADEASDVGLLDDLAGLGFEPIPTTDRLDGDRSDVGARAEDAELDDPNEPVDPSIATGIDEGAPGLFDRPHPEASDDDGALTDTDGVSYVPLDPGLIDLTEQVLVDAEAAAAEAKRYTDWADRMRTKRQRDQAHIRGVDFVPLDDGPVHWTAETVIGRAGRHEVSDPSAVGAPAELVEALGQLGLEPGASPEEAAVAYRQLAKRHHPDRWASAEPDVQQEHSEAMMRVNAAYDALRREHSR
jgi:DnaJ-domain-containing protein 1